MSASRRRSRIRFSSARSVIGPISDLAELNKIRERLREADLELLVIRVGD